MLKRQKNKLFEVVQESGLDGSQFRSTETTEKDLVAFPIGAPQEYLRHAFVIQLEHSPLKFTIVELSDTYDLFSVRFVPLSRDFQETDWVGRGSVNRYSFEDVIEIFKSWLDRHVKGYLEEILLPDLWSQLENITLTRLTPLISERDTSEFSKGEKVQIRLALDHFQHAVIQDFNPSQEQIAEISHQLKYLSDAVDRLNRRDWRGLAVTTVLSIAIALSCDTQTGKVLLNMFQQALQSALHLLP